MHLEICRSVKMQVKWTSQLITNNPDRHHLEFQRLKMPAEWKNCRWLFRLKSCSYWWWCRNGRWSRLALTRRMWKQLDTDFLPRMAWRHNHPSHISSICLMSRGWHLLSWLILVNATRESLPFHLSSAHWPWSPSPWYDELLQNCNIKRKCEF